MRDPNGRPRWKRNYGENRTRIPRKKGSRKILDGLQELVDERIRRIKKPAAVETAGE